MLFHCKPWNKKFSLFHRKHREQQRETKGGEARTREMEEGGAAEGMEVDGSDEDAAEEEHHVPYVELLQPPVSLPPAEQQDRRTPALQRIADIKRKEEELARRLQEQGDAFEDDYILMPRLEVLALDSPLWGDPAAFEQHLRDKEGWARELAQGSFRVETGAAEILQRSDVMVGHPHQRSRTKHWMWCAGPPRAADEFPPFSRCAPCPSALWYTTWCASC